MPFSYYQMKKHLYRERYYENKRKEQENFEMYKKYGGEKEYYKQQYIKLMKNEPYPEPVVGNDLVIGLDTEGGATLLETEPVVGADKVCPTEDVADVA